MRFYWLLESVCVMLVRAMHFFSSLTLTTLRSFVHKQITVTNEDSKVYLYSCSWKQKQIHTNTYTQKKKQNKLKRNHSSRHAMHMEIAFLFFIIYCGFLFLLMICFLLKKFLFFSYLHTYTHIL